MSGASGILRLKRYWLPKLSRSHALQLKYSRAVKRSSHMQINASSKSRLDLRTVVSNLSTAFKARDSPPVSTLGYAAVLVPLFEDSSGAVRVLLTQRSSNLPTHAGEVCLPGGKRDPVDTDDVATALREANEELGLLPQQAQVVACGPPFLSKHMLSVAPVIATIPPDFVPVPNPDEVDSVFSMPLERVLTAQGHRHKDMAWQGWEYRVHFFEHEGYNVWGLTAAILIHIAKSAFQANPEFEEKAPIHLDYEQLVFDGKQLGLRPPAETSGEAPATGWPTTHFLGSVKR